MQRYFFTISFNGSDYFGWQRQPRQHSVQEEIENALGKIHSNRSVTVIGCGRTDSGVHAAHFVFHVDLPSITDPEKFLFKLNRMLPHSIVVHSFAAVSADSHARFDATRRTYRYFIHQQKNAFINETSCFVASKLDFEQMNAAAQHLLGTQDFTSLSKLHTDVKTNICTIYAAHWVYDTDRPYFEITADRFLRNMVRATVGTLLDVGTGKISPDSLRAILAAKDRQAASTSVPAHGLFLWEVAYA